jgi:hypothetical protein
MNMGNTQQDNTHRPRKATIAERKLHMNFEKRLKTISEKFHTTASKHRNTEERDEIIAQFAEVYPGYELLIQ